MTVRIDTTWTNLYLPTFGPLLLEAISCLTLVNVTNSGGSDNSNPDGGQYPPGYGEVPGLPRDGYGVDASGNPTYSAPTEKYPDYQQPGAYGTSPAPESQGQYGSRNPPATPNQYGGTDQYGGSPQPYGTPNPYAAPNQYSGQAQYGGQNQYAAPNQYGAPTPGYGPPNAYGAPYAQHPGTNGLAIAALVVSIVGGCVYGVGAIVGIILGVVALGQIKRSGEQGRGLAIAGIALGAAYILGWILFFLVMVIAAASSGV